MQITIDVPELRCARCSATAPVQAHLLYCRDRAPQQLRDALQAVTTASPDTAAVDSTGKAWEIVTADTPSGWVRGPHGRNLCASCGALWAVEQRAFLKRPQAEPAVVKAPTNAVSYSSLLPGPRAQSKPAAAAVVVKAPTKKHILRAPYKPAVTRPRPVTRPLVTKTTHGSSVVLLERKAGTSVTKRLPRSSARVSPSKTTLCAATPGTLRTNNGSTLPIPRAALPKR